jgi:hypothetical protein
MPKVSGQEIISVSTEKSFRALVLVAAATILTKAYAVPLDEMSLLGAKLPQSLFDVALLVAVLGLLYVYVVKWLGDLAAFRLWYSESSIWSQFGTNMKLDKNFISGGIQLLLDLHEQQRAGMPPVEKLPEEMKRRFEEFKTNVELYAVRLDAAGQKFATLSAFGHFYVWVQHFIFPVGLALFAVGLLLRYGSFLPPAHL